jgi:2'-hydroxyisoflavone reductase
LPLQYIDGRDLAAWLLHTADAGIGGVFNTVSEPCRTTMRGLALAARPQRQEPGYDGTR